MHARMLARTITLTNSMTKDGNRRGMGRAREAFPSLRKIAGTGAVVVLSLSLLLSFTVGAVSSPRDGGSSIDPPEYWKYMWGWLFFRAPSDNHWNQSEYYFGGILYTGGAARSPEASSLIQSVDWTGPNPNYYYFAVELPNPLPGPDDLLFMVSEVSSEPPPGGRDLPGGVVKEKALLDPVAFESRKRYITLEAEQMEAVEEEVVTTYRECEAARMTWQEYLDVTAQPAPILTARSHTRALLERPQLLPKEGDLDPWRLPASPVSLTAELIEDTEIRFDDVTRGTAMSGRALAFEPTAVTPQEAFTPPLGVAPDLSFQRSPDLVPVEVMTIKGGMEGVRATLTDLCHPSAPVATARSDSQGFYQFRLEQVGRDGPYHLRLEKGDLSAEVCVEYEEALAPIALGGIVLRNGHPGVDCRCP